MDWISFQYADPFKAEYFCSLFNVFSLITTKNNNVYNVRFPFIQDVFYKKFLMLSFNFIQKPYGILKWKTGGKSVNEAETQRALSIFVMNKTYFIDGNYKKYI